MIIRHNPNYIIQTMVIANDGDWVTYEDHIAEVNALKARIAELEGEKKTLYDWGKIPDRYNYVATDYNGDVFAYVTEPRIVMLNWGGVKGTNVLHLGCNEVFNWEDSLEKRPGT